MAKAGNIMPQCLQGAILNLVRHSSDDIDSLVEKIQHRLRRSLVVGDEVNFKADDTVMKGEVMMVHDNRPTPVKINLVSECKGSPSSDKENDFVAGKDSEVDKIKYSVKINGKTVCSIPAYALTRTKELPTGNAIRKFIMSTSKYTENTPQTSGSWSVKQPAMKRKLVSPAEKSNKKSKTSSKPKVPVQQRTLDAFVKMGRLGSAKNVIVVSKTPTKATNKTPEKVSTPRQRKAFDKSPAKSDGNADTKPKSPRTTPKSPRTTPAKKTVIDLWEKSPRLIRTLTPPCVVDLSNDMVENNSKCKSKTTKQSQSGGRKPAAKNNTASTKTVKPKAGEDIIVLKPRVEVQDCNVLRKGATAVSVVMGSPVEASDDSEKTIPVMIKEIKTDSEGHTKTSFKQLGHLVEAGKDSGSKKLVKAESKNGLKQLTLFDLARAKAPGVSLDRFASVTPPTPKVLRKYRKALKEDNARTQKQCILTAAKELTEQQRNLLPSPMKSLVHDKVQFLQTRDKLKAMTEEEKRAYYREKYKNHQPVRTHQVQMQRKEDTVLTDSKQLPVADSVTLPEELPMSSLDDAMFVSGFLMSFKSYLVKPETTRYNHYTFDTLAKYLVAKDAKVVEVVIAMLQTLLKDYTFSEAFELDMPLKHLTVNKNTLVNILYLTFKLTSMKQERLLGETAQLSELADSIKMFSVCSELPPLTLLECLKTLCMLLLDGQGLVQHQEDMQAKLHQCFKERNLIIKTHADFKKEHGGDEVANESGRSSPATNEEDLPQAQSLAEALKMRREMSKRSAEEREKKQAEEKKLKHIAAERIYLEKQKITIEDKLKEAIAANRLCKRLSPLGTDRDHSRYWVFPGHQGLYVEKGWTNEHYYYNVSSEAMDDIVLMEPADQFTNKVPVACAHAWFHYKDKGAIDELVAALNQNGFRESLLSRRIKENYSQITSVPASKSSSANTSEDEDIQSDQGLSPIESFKEDLLDLENRVRSAGLGGIENYDEWTAKVEQASSVETLGSCLIDCLAGVYENKRCGVMVSSKKKSHLFQPKPVIKEEDNENIDNNDEVEKSKSVRKWQESVKDAITISRLYVLMEILDMSVSWEKSVDNAKCRVCKRKGNDATLLLCDGCDLGFHMDCLRMTKKDVPEGDWFCPSCKPPEERSSRNRRNLKDISDSEEDNEDASEEDETSSEEEEEEMCTVCNHGGEVAICDTCLSAFHVACHQPPLRAVPRFAWTCHTCRFGTKMKKNKRQLDSSIESESQNDDSTTEASVTKSRRKDVIVPVTKKAKAGNDVNQNKKSSQTAAQSKSIKNEELSQRQGRPTRNSADSRQARDVSTDSDEAEEDEVKKSEPIRPTRRGSATAPKEEVNSVSQTCNRMSKGTKHKKQVKNVKKKVAKHSKASATKLKRVSPRASSSKTPSEDSAYDTSDADTIVESDDEVQLNMSQEQEEISKYISPSKRSRKSDPKEVAVQLTLIDCIGFNGNKKTKKELTPEQLTQNLKTVHRKLWAHRSSWPFESPVDREEVPDYYEVISKPVDLTSILHKISDYESAEEFVEDIRQMIFNSFDYNPRDSKVAKLSVTFEDYFSNVLLAKYLPGTDYKRQQVLFGFGS